MRRSRLIPLALLPLLALFALFALLAGPALAQDGVAQEAVPLVPLGSLSHDGTPGVAPHGAADAPAIVNGRLTRGAFPTVAALLLVIGDDTDPGPTRPALAQFCTATLVGCRTLVSAAHCFCSVEAANFDQCESLPGRVEPENFVVYLQHGGIFPVESVHLARLYEFTRRKDVAVVRLATPVNGIAPTPINEVGTPAPGSSGVVAGFGLTAAGRTNGGVKRAGQVRSSRCRGVPDGAHVCWNFEHPVGPPGIDSNTCQGDSGGPLFMNLGGRQVLAGVTSGGGPTCLANDESFDTNVFSERAFIRRFGGADLDNRTCGNLPQAGGNGTTILVAPIDQVFLNRTIPRRQFNFNVGPGTAALLVSLNGRDGNGIVSFDFDLVLTSPSGVVHRSPLEPTADDDLLSSFDAIPIAAPEPGPWTAVVQKGDERPNRNNGVFQLTATLFAASGADP